MLEIDIRTLLDRPGSSRRVHVDEPLEGLSTELAGVPEERPVDVDVQLESVVEGIYVAGRVSGRMRLHCARCLRSFEEDFRLDVAELYAREPDEEQDEYALGEGVVDLEPMVRDAVVLAMPFAPVCREGCRGLCERCGGDRNLGECDCGPRVDPRWAALESLKLD